MHLTVNIYQQDETTVIERPRPLAIVQPMTAKRGSRKARIAGMAREILDVAGAAELLGVSPATVYKLAREGKLPATKVGREWRFARARLIDWVADGTQSGQLERLFKKAKPRPR